MWQFNGLNVLNSPANFMSCGGGGGCYNSINYPKHRSCGGGGGCGSSNYSSCGSSNYGCGGTGGCG